MRADRLECSCGEVALTTSTPPESIYLCACSECRRASGSAFAWRAKFARAAVELTGAPTTWRRLGDAGRWVEHAFCGCCGTGLYMTAEAIPDHVVVSVPCFVDNAPPPQFLFRGEGLPGWCALTLGRGAQAPEARRGPA